MIKWYHSNIIMLNSVIYEYIIIWVTRVENKKIYISRKFKIHEAFHLRKEKDFGKTDFIWHTTRMQQMISGS